MSFMVSIIRTDKPDPNLVVRKNVLPIDGFGKMREILRFLKSDPQKIDLVYTCESVTEDQRNAVIYFLKQIRCLSETHEVTKYGKQIIETSASCDRNDELAGMISKFVETNLLYKKQVMQVVAGSNPITINSEEYGEQLDWLVLIQFLGLAHERRVNKLRHYRWTIIGKNVASKILRPPTVVKLPSEPGRIEKIVSFLKSWKGCLLIASAVALIILLIFILRGYKCVHIPRTKIGIDLVESFNNHFPSVCSSP